MPIEHRGSFVVLRDASGRDVEKVLDRGESTRETWRQMLRKMTDNGIEQFTILREISRGTPFVARLPDGRETEPQVPTLETQRQAAKDLIEFMHGKAVAQTEVMKAEEEAQAMEQIRALSDEELKQRVAKALEAQRAPSALPSVSAEGTVPARVESDSTSGDR